MRAALADGLAAARIAAERPELWVPGALVWIATAGWLPILLVVAPLPGEGDLAFLGARLASSRAWPLNAVALLAGIAAGVLAAFTLAALGEAALWQRVRAATSPAGELSRVGVGAIRMLAVKLVAALPAAGALVVLGAATAAVAPGEFQSPDIGGDLGARILGRIAPLLVVLGVSLLAGQALAAAAERRAIHRPPLSLGSAFAGAIDDLRSAPGGVAAVAVTSMAVSVSYVVASLLLLRVLWAPIGAQLDAGLGVDAGVAPLLVGFVAIWLCLVLAGGMVHAWASVWWTLVLAALQDRPGIRPSDAEGIGSA